MARALIVVDVQNDFCEGGALPVAGGEEVASAISGYLAQDPRYDVVVATRDNHVDPNEHFSDDPDYVNTWPPHCVAGTHGAEFHPNLRWRTFAAVFDKGEHSAAYSGFEGRDHQRKGITLVDFLRSRGVDQVDVCGIATDHCVRATALDAARHGFGTTVLVDLTAAVDPDGVRDVLSEWGQAGIEVRRVRQ